MKKVFRCVCFLGSVVCAIVPMQSTDNSAGNARSSGPFGSSSMTMRLLSIVGILLVLTSRSVPAQAPVPPTSSPTIDWPKVNEEAVSKLGEYIRINTSNPPGNEIAAAKWFGQIFQAEGIPYEIAESEPGRGNIVARLKGNGTEPALILLAHMDVVPVSPQFWTVNPFAAVVRDDYMWGRGTLDMKGLGTAELMAFLLLHRNDVPLRRDVIFLGTADEEAGGMHGAGWVVKNRPEWIRGAGFLVTETSSSYAAESGKPTQYRIIIGEKAPAWLKLTSKGRSGHAAYPNPESATNRLIGALERLRMQRQPLEVTPVVRRAFHTQAPFEDEPWRTRFQDIDAYVRTAGAYDELLKRPAVLTLLANTVAVTQMEGSNKINVVPTTATAGLDCRLVPGITIDEWVRRIRDTVRDDSISIETVLNWNPNDSADSPLTAEIASAVKHLDPSAAVVEDVLPAFTDSHYFRDIGIRSYGFAVFPVNATDRTRVHGNDERIPLDVFAKGTRLMWDVVYGFSRSR